MTCHDAFFASSRKHSRRFVGVRRHWRGALALFAALLPATLAAAQEPPPLTLVATAVGCHWRYAYARAAGGGAVFDPSGTRCTVAAYCPLGLDPDRAAAVPVGVPVRLVASSADKLRVLAVPPLHLQIDAVPGETLAATITIAAEGLYPGRQGADCAGDPSAIAPAFRALAPAAFEAWLKEKRRAR